VASGARQDEAFEHVVLSYPFTGRWLARNSPARRVPSHATHLMGTTYAIDFIAVDARGRSAPRGWRAAVATEPAEAFIGFGAPILAPCSGRVVIVHDGEPDHEARRSQLTLLRYRLGQARRARGGPPAIAGNHVVIAVDTEGPFVPSRTFAVGRSRSPWATRSEQSTSSARAGTPGTARSRTCTSRRATAPTGTRREDYPSPSRPTAHRACRGVRDRHGVTHSMRATPSHQPRTVSPRPHSAHA
jgi:hypothetical protein